MLLLAVVPVIEPGPTVAAVELILHVTVAPDTILAVNAIVPPVQPGLGLPANAVGAAGVAGAALTVITFDSADTHPASLVTW